MIMFMRSSLAHVGVLLILGLQCLNAVPSDWPAHYPDWWYNGAPSQSVIDIDDAGDLGSGGGGGGSGNVWKLTSPDGSITALSVNASGHLILSEVPGDVGLGPFTSN